MKKKHPFAAAQPLHNKTHRLPKRTGRILIGILLVSFVIYWIVCYFLVSLALVPSFMEKTEVFESVTDSSIEALVQTSDIQNNRSAAIDETKEWLKTVRAEKLSVTTADGYRLIGVAFAPNDANSTRQDSSLQADDAFQQSDSRWALLLHGYTGWKEELYPLAYRYVQEGYHVLVPDMRCSGESEGDFIGMGWTDRLDNLLWLSEITSRSPNGSIVIHGQSMGASCALMMSGELLPSQVRAIISDCAYTDAYQMFAKQMKDWFSLPSFPILDSMNLMLQLRGGYDLKDASALESVKKTRLPVLIIHGADDHMVPLQMAHQLYEAAGGPKELLIVPGAGHAQAPDKDPETYYRTVFSFLRQYE